MPDIAAQIAQMEQQYSAAVRAQAVAEARLEQARKTEADALSRLTELGFPTVADAEQWLADSGQALQQQVAALMAELEGLPR